MAMTGQGRPVMIRAGRGCRVLAAPSVAGDAGVVGCAARVIGGAGSPAGGRFNGSWSARGRATCFPPKAAAPRQSSSCRAPSCSATAAAWLRASRARRSASTTGRTSASGRAVWTDARGDRVFSALRGEPLPTGRRIIGTITGGTGRYAGVDRRLLAHVAVRRRRRRRRRCRDGRRSAGPVPATRHSRDGGAAADRRTVVVRRR